MKNLKQIVPVIIVILLMMISFSGSAQSNKNNPYDYIGIAHNEILAEFLKSNNFTKLSNNDIVEVINKITLANKVGGKFIKIELTEYEFGISDFKNNFKNVVNNAKVSKPAKIKLQSLLDYMIELGFSTNGSTYADFYNYIIKFENSILKNKQLNSDDLQLILSSTSIARHSGFLWNNYLTNFTIKKSSSSKMSASSVRKWWQWVIIGSADVAGGILGGSAGPAGIAGGASTASGLAIKLTDPKIK